MKNIRRAAAALTVLALAGCGKSVDAKREDIIKCSAFSLALITVPGGSPLLSSVEASLTKDGITGAETFSMSSAAQQYARGLDPAKVTRLAQEGSSAAADLVRNNDANGIADYLKGCVATYKDLGS